MDRLLMTIPCERGELFYIRSGRRILLANCEPAIQIYEHTDRIAALGGYGLKHIYAALVLCGEPKLTREVDKAFLDKVESFDLTTDIQRKDGAFEVLHFVNISPEKIDLEGEWTFSLHERQETLRRLLTL